MRHMAHRVACNLGHLVVRRVTHLWDIKTGSDTTDRCSNGESSGLKRTQPQTIHEFLHPSRLDFRASLRFQQRSNELDKFIIKYRKIYTFQSFRVNCLGIMVQKDHMFTNVPDFHEQMLAGPHGIFFPFKDLRSWIVLVLPSNLVSCLKGPS